MIQELLGGGSANPPTGFFGERKSIPFSSSSTPLLTTTNTTIVMNTPHSSNTGSSTGGGGSGVATANNNNNNNNNSETNNNSSQNLRCPRCDSTNTKFCYYNNYNLTQPRHFCKTCRRYWTKGGTLRNVPIGGGCRKNKPTISSSSATSAAMSKSSTPNHHHFMAKAAKANLSSEMLVNENNSSLFLGNGLLDHPLQTPGPNPILWPSFPQAQNSHILALLRGGSTPFSNPNPNPNPNPNSNPSTTTTSSVFTSLGLDSYGHNNGAPSLLGSFTRSNQNQLNGFGPDFGENNNGGSGNILDLYQRLKSSSNYGYCGGNENPGAVILGNMLGTSTSSMSSTMLEATPLSAGGGDHMGGGYGFMNTSPAISSWSDFPAVPINGAYP